MKQVLVILVALFALSQPALARKFAFPPAEREAMVSIPEHWKIFEIADGYKALSPDREVFLSIRYLKYSSLREITEINRDWMADNEIDARIVPTTRDVTINGLAASMVTYETTDAIGPTTVDFILMPVSTGQIVVMTRWGSDKDRSANDREIHAITNSVHAIE